jgi:hypothetical protein
MIISRTIQRTGLMAASFLILLVFSLPGYAQTQSAKTFNAVVTDAKGVETELTNIFFYWEEKISETSFVPNELREVPVNRGTATIKVKFDTIKQIEVRKGSEAGLPVLAITLANGKTGEFQLAIDGTFRGESDFGEVEFQPSGLSKIVFQ